MSSAIYTNACVRSKVDPVNRTRGLFGEPGVVMPAYDENPSPQAVIKRTRDRMATVRKALDAIAGGGSSDRNERSRQAAKNLEMLFDRKEMLQVSELGVHATELNAGLKDLADYCSAYRVPMTIEPDRASRLKAAIRSFVASPVATGSFIATSGTASQTTPLQPASSGSSTSAGLGGASVSSSRVPDPKNEGGIRQLWIDVGRCKDTQTCNRLTVRARWFEPNPGTIKFWQDDDRFVHGVDRRVVFVCESPTKKTLGKPFNVPDVVTQGARCWGGDNAFVTDDFWQVREKYGLGSTWITNVVKCGATVSARPVSDEIHACSGFLRRELEMLQPAVIALVGKSKTVEMYHKSVAKSGPRFTTLPAVIPITHYAYARRPGGRGRMMEVWDPEFDAIMRELVKRGLSEPQWLALN